MTLSISLKLIQVIIALAIFFQTLEYLFLKKTFSEIGIWRWSQIKIDLISMPQSVQHLFDFILNDQHFIIILWIRLFTAIFYIIYPDFIFIFILFLSSFFIAKRFRGSFNGGSDYMSLIILSTLCLQAIFSSSIITKGVLWYIAIQSVTSYFMAGLVKLKQKNWRNGSALIGFIQSPNYRPAPIIKKLLLIKPMALIVCWGVIVFELSFPIILTQHSSNLLIWLFVGFIFHLLNFFIFGLNRFLIVWLATYPAIYLVATTN